METPWRTIEFHEYVETAHHVTTNLHTQTKMAAQGETFPYISTQILDRFSEKDQVLEKVSEYSSKTTLEVSIYRKKFKLLRLF